MRLRILKRVSTFTLIIWKQISFYIFRNFFQKRSHFRLWNFFYNRRSLPACWLRRFSPLLLPHKAIRKGSPKSGQMVTCGYFSSGCQCLKHQVWIIWYHGIWSLFAWICWLTSSGKGSLAWISQWFFVFSLGCLFKKKKNWEFFSISWWFQNQGWQLSQEAMSAILWGVPSIMGKYQSLNS